MSGYSLLTSLATDVPAKNEISNGDFNKGIAGWAADNSTHTVTGGVLINTGNGNGTSSLPRSRQETNLLLKVGDKIYARAEAMVTNPDCLALQLRFGGTINTGNIFKTLSDPVENKLYELSEVFDVDIQTGNARIALCHNYPNAQTADGKSMIVERVLAVNLTLVFGEGNEPTREQMDMILTQFPKSWFDGTRNLFNAKLFMGMYFKKMKELENAITALGGGS